MSGRSSGDGSGKEGSGSRRSGLQETPNSEEGIMLPGADSKERLYEQRRDKKTFRVVTVMVYVLCVSLAAIILSFYYVFFWEPKGKHYTQVVLVTPSATAATASTPCFTHEQRSDPTIATKVKGESNSSTFTPTTPNIMDDISTMTDLENDTTTNETVTFISKKTPRKKRRIPDPMLNVDDLL